MVPKACLDPTFQICLRNRARLCLQSGAACDSTAFHGLLHFCICRPAPALALARPTRYNLCYYFLRRKIFFKSKYLICPTQLHWLGGPSQLWPRLTDTDLESPVFRIARQTQSCFARVRPKAACSSLPFNCCQLTIYYLLD